MNQRLPSGPAVMRRWTRASRREGELAEEAAAAAHLPDPVLPGFGEPEVAVRTGRDASGLAARCDGKLEDVAERRDQPDLVLHRNGEPDVAVPSQGDAGRELVGRQREFSDEACHRQEPDRVVGRVPEEAAGTRHQRVRCAQGELCDGTGRRDPAEDLVVAFGEPHVAVRADGDCLGGAARRHELRDLPRRGAPADPLTVGEPEISVRTGRDRLRRAVPGQLEFDALARRAHSADRIGCRVPEVAVRAGRDVQGRAALRRELRNFLGAGEPGQADPDKHRQQTKQPRATPRRAHVSLLFADRRKSPSWRKTGTRREICKAFGDPPEKRRSSRVTAPPRPRSKSPRTRLGRRRGRPGRKGSRRRR